MPRTKYNSSELRPSSGTVERLSRLIKKSSAGLIVAAQLSERSDRQAVLNFGTQLAWPILADITSGLRFDSESILESTPVCAHYNLYLRELEKRGALSPDLVVQFGGLPVGAVLNDFMGELTCPVIQVSASWQRQDPDGTVSDRIICNPLDFCSAVLAQQSSSSSSLAAILEKAEAECLEIIKEGQQTTGLSEWAVTADAFRLSKKGQVIFLGNSMPIRHADTYALAESKELIIGYQRGVSGIDGVVADALGFANGLGRPLTLIVGDLSFIHDLNSLLLLKEAKAPISIVLLNNDGGGIFSFLPSVTDSALFDKFFGTPHGITFESAAKLFGLSYACPKNAEEFRTAYSQSLVAGRLSLIEVQCKRSAALEEHKKFIELIRQRL